MFSASILAMTRASDRQMRGAVLNMLQNAGQDAIISALGGPSSFFAGLLRGGLRTLARENIQQEAERRVWLQTDRTARPWAHNWQSQPRQPAGRPEGGEWMKGRLRYKAWEAAPISRSKRQAIARNRKAGIRATQAYKARRAAAGHTHSRTIRTSWGTY